MRTNLLVGIFLILFSSPGLQAQVEALEDESGFTVNAVDLNFRLFAFGIPGNDVHRAYGVGFSGVGGSRPMIEAFVPDVNILPPIIPSLVNTPVGSSSAGQPLIISFERPVRRLTFVTLFERPALAVSAFAPDGTLLGRLDFPSPVPGEGSFTGLQTDHPWGMGKVVLDYGEDPTPEGIINLRFDPLEPVVFETVLPQIAESRHPTAPSVSTRFTLLNLSATTAQVQVTFYASDGTPQPAGLPNPLMLEQDEVQFFEARNFVGDDFQGYARVRSTAPVAADARLRIFRGAGGAVSEAGVAAVPGRFLQYGAVEWSAPVGTVQPVVRRLDTAVALVNLSSEPTEVWIVLSEAAAPGVRGGRTLILEPGRQRTFFLSQEFGEQPPQARGGLRIVSDQPVAAMLLRTIDGLPVANLSVDGPR